MVVQDWFATLSLVISIITMVRQIQRDKKDSEFQEYQKDFEKYKEIQRLQEKRSDDLQSQINNRSELIPYFSIDHAKSILDLDTMVVELFFTNVGKESATNIGIVQLRKGKYGIPIYFNTDYMKDDEPIHGIHTYFSEYFAMPKESISLKISSTDGSQQQLYFMNFKIQFTDLLGRIYEQEFRFGYDNMFVNGINKNSISYPPKLIKDINGKEQ
ncbi:hypothetical protein AB3331_05290 [Streptococcus sp. H49]|uniref:hypothetical protein n=1 Tax=Streptococcus huangxiaojuni TaxID=3237239 RepID=UPI0034A41848